MKVLKKAKAKSRVIASDVAVTKYNRETWFAVPVGGGLYQVSTQHWGYKGLYPAENLSVVFGSTHRVEWVSEGVKVVKALIPL